MERSKRWGPFSGAQLTIIICVGIVTVLFPIGVWAVSGSNVFVTDATSGNQATVSGGNLHVEPRPGAQARYLLQPSGTTKTSIGSFPPGTPARVTHLTVANSAATATAEVKLGVRVRTSGSGTCAQGLTTGTGFATGSDYTVVVAGPHATVDEDFAGGGIDIAIVGTANAKLLCPYVQMLQGSAILTVLEST